MFKYATLATMLALLLTAALCAQQGPDLSLDAAANDQPAPAVAPDAGPVQTTPVASQELLTEDCGCNHQDACACQSHCQMTLKEKHYYYRSVRQSFDRGPCCADYFGGFGPLWDTYCADRLAGCGAHCGSAASCGGCASCSRPMRHRFARPHCDNCDVSAVACDCDSSSFAAPQSDAIDIGQPPQPTEADAPSVAPPDPKEPAPAPKSASARRKWWQAIGWRAKR